MALKDDLEYAKAKVTQIEQQIKNGKCSETGHDWQSYGGRNAGCDDACCCSVPVNVCTKCGDCDYGDNADASQVIADCTTKSATS